MRIIHTKTTENTDQNGGFRKLFQMWSTLTTHRFENVPFLFWTGENGDDGHDEKSVIYCRFHQRFQAVKCIRFRIKTIRKRIRVERWKQNENVCG